MLIQIKDLLSKTKEIGTIIKKLPENEFTDLVKNTVNDILESRKEKDKNYLYFGLFGYTPSFNDGDPCVHTYYVCTLTREKVIEYIDDEGILDELSKNFALGSDLESSLSEKTDEEIQAIIASDSLEKNALQEYGYENHLAGDDCLNFIMQKRLGTNFEVIAKLSNNVVASMSYDYHECGY